MPFHPAWLIVILVIILLLFGAKRLPELGNSLGRSMGEFRKGVEGKPTGEEPPDTKS